MPYQASVFNVLIASPGDVQVERNLVRDVIHEWNAIHSSARSILFQPIAWETHSHPSMEGRAQGVLNNQILQNADLLVAIFWTRIGTPTGEAPGGSVEELDRHVKAGKPAMVYFSSAPVLLDSVDDSQYKALKEFKEQCRGKGLVETYDSPTEFRQKFSRQLASKINNESFFAVRSPVADDVLPILPVREIPSLSEEAKTLLLEAVADRHGTVMHAKFIGGVEVQTNGKQFIERGNSRSRAAWEGALKELASLDLLEAVGNKGEIYQVTNAGYKMAELLKN